MAKKIAAILTLLIATFAFSENATYKTISWKEAIDISKSKQGALFLDVRTQEEVASGAVATAKNIPLQTLEIRYSELPKDKNILIYCRSGRRSKSASEFLASKGYTHIYNVDGGFLSAPPAAAFK